MCSHWLYYFPFLLLFYGPGFGNVHAQEREVPFYPPAGTRLLCIGQDTQTIEEYLDGVSIKPAGYMTYTSIQNMDGLFDNGKDYGAGYSNAWLWSEREPGSILQIGLYMVGALKDLTKGIYDTNIHKLGAFCLQANIPVFLRIGYEFDGPHNQYNPSDYQFAYRYIVDHLEDQGVHNIAFVWHTYAGNKNARLMDWYPGNNYVDWIGISYFDQDVSYYDPALALSKKLKKPVMIGEATPRGLGATMDAISWKAWYGPLFEFMNDNDIRILSYINSNWNAQPMWQDGGWQDARVEASAYVLQKWQQMLNDPSWLLPGKALFTKLNFPSPEKEQI